jgi:beta-1,4-mannooligosaccharide/beta-1,4-mannosyl-N-acetylglucosamine phosphorylase
VVWLENLSYITWCNGYHDSLIGIGYRFDFERFQFLENALLPFNRNGDIFPCQIHGRYLRISRPSDNGHTPFGDIFVCQSHDLIHWSQRRFMMGVKSGWHSTKIETGPVPIDTPEGWPLRRWTRSSISSYELGAIGHLVTGENALHSPL